MEEIREQNSLLGLSNDWPGDLRIHALVERASGLFIWASTAYKFIKGYDPEERLGMLLRAGNNSNAESALDSLYVTALQSLGEWTDTVFSADFRAVVGTILVARDPLSTTAINYLLRLEGQRPPAHAISRLGCILYMNSIVRILHPSFADFLSNKLRCKCDDWFIDRIAHNVRIAAHCLDHLDSVLKYNLCDLQLSLTPVDATLRDDIAYACVFWVDHVCMIAETSLIIEKLERFLFKHLLHWFEAMSILKKPRDMVGLLSHILNWIKVCYLF
jgi:hypothetical protein